MPKKKKVQKRWWGWTVSQVCFLLVLGGFLLGIPGQGTYVLSSWQGKSAIKTLPFPVFKPAPYPINHTKITPGAEVTATGVAVLDVDSGLYLYKRNEDELLAPASTTKILTALVALDAYALDDVVTVKNVLVDGQSIGLVSGERITVENLLFGALVQSGNDAAFALADFYPGGLDSFVKAMNDKAKQLNLTQSHFTNPMGFDDKDHKMTPVDLARLAASAVKNKIISKIVSIPQITISDVTYTHFHTLTNVNQLLGKIPGVGGIKTGWTQEAGENLVTLVERNGHKVILVVLHSNDRFRDTKTLIDWVFQYYQWETL